MKKAILVLLTLLICIPTTLALSGRFGDVPTNKWYKPAVDKLAKMGIIEGYSDGTYQPEKCVNRAEMATVVDRLLDYLDSDKFYTQDDNNSENSLYLGEKFKVKLSDPGDGGYVFNEPSFNQDVIKLLSHEDIKPTTEGLLGYFGYDIWTFETVSEGSTDLAMSNQRPWEATAPRDSFKIQIEVISETQAVTDN